MAFFSRLARLYNKLLNRHKYPVQIISGGTLWCVGDMLSQMITAERPPAKEADQKEDRFQIDWKRVRTMTFYGLAVSSPIFTFWYTYLDKATSRIFSKHLAESASKAQLGTITSKIFESTVSLRIWKIIGFKMVADVCLFDPFYLTLFFTATNLFEGQSLATVKQKLRQELGGTYLADVIVWTPVQLLNFRFVPVIYQPLVVQSCNVGWNAYLSYVQHRRLEQ